MNHWEFLPLSFAGCVNLIKMIVLPKFLYLFQNIPILIKKSFFKALDKSIPPFIWGNKPRRINKAFLQEPKCLGGLALPNFLFYYCACNIQKLLHWFDERPIAGKADWVQMEASSCPHHLGSMVSSALPLFSNNLSSSLTVNQSIRIWAQFRRHFGLQGPSILSPSKFNHVCSFLYRLFFCRWFEKGIRSINNLYVEGTFASFSQLSQIYDLPKKHFFHYLQIRNFAQKVFSSFPNESTKSQIDNLLALTADSRGLISRIYELIYNINLCLTKHLKKPGKLT